MRREERSGLSADRDMEARQSGNLFKVPQPVRWSWVHTQAGPPRSFLTWLPLAPQLAYSGQEGAHVDVAG